MGFLFSKLNKLIQSNTPCTILMVGLDGAGKTTMFNQFAGAEVEKTIIPSIGLNAETVSYKNITFNVFDISGEKKVRHLWTPYYYSAHGIIYVIDSSHTSRFEEAKKELFNLLRLDEMQICPVLVYANKQDFRGAISPNGVIEALDLRLLGSRPWHVQGSCAVDGSGVFEGLDWLASNIKI